MVPVIAHPVREHRIPQPGVWLSQEPRELNETILAEATEIVCFRLDGLNSLGRLADYNFPRQDELPGLAKGQFVAWNKQSGGVTVGKLF